jgi:hypothetical protein
MDKANYTPNTGLVQDPAKRRVLQQTLGVIGAVLGTIIIVDASTPAFDLTAITTPAAAGYAYVTALFGFGSTVPNIPKR